ncbi:MAG TPA: ROK family protein [Acidimicrobiales bacterium]
MEALVVSTDDVLAIDIGATNIKFARVDAVGRLQGSLKRRATPYPCTPDRLVNWIAQRAQHIDLQRVGVGFPGEFDDGHVVRPGNLSRPGGVGTDLDDDLDRLWSGFALETALRAATGRDVRVVNDATLAALGCCRGVGTEMVVTLGTGCGLALRVSGVRQRVRDLGRTMFSDDQTYDQALGERARSRDDEEWLNAVRKAVSELALEFGATKVYLAGGNARRISRDLFEGVAFDFEIAGNEASLRGAPRLFE